MSDVRTIRVFSASPGNLAVERPGVGWDQLARTHLGHPQRVTGDPTLTRRCESSRERRPTGHSLAPTASRERHDLATDTRTPSAAQCDADDAGKSTADWLRWKNTTGETGSWSAVVSATITG